MTVLWLVLGAAFLFVFAVAVYGALEIPKIPYLAVPYTPKDFGLVFEDVSFLSHDGLKLTGWFLPAAFQVLDTMTLARLYSEITFAHFQNYKLQTLCEALEVPPGNHDALVDVRATVAIARKMLKFLRDDRI